MARWNEMIKRNDNETLTEFYINNKDDNDIKVIIEVINSICTAHYGNSTPEFNKQISDFVTEFKKENLHFLFENQTMPVFKMYQENIAARLRESQNKMNRELSQKEKRTADELSEKLFKLKHDFAYSASRYSEQSTLEYPTTKERLSDTLKALLHTNGVIVFYFVIFKKKYAVGYFAKNQKFTEIKPKKMKANTQDSTIIFTKFNNIESLIRKSKNIENIIIKKEKNLEK